MLKIHFLYLFLCLSLTGCGQGLANYSPQPVGSQAGNGLGDIHKGDLTPDDSEPVSKPVLLWISDATGLPATQMMLIGKNFIGTTEVILNGSSVPFSIFSDSQLFLTVAPNTVATSLSVTNTAGTASKTAPARPAGDSEAQP